ncbi:Uncharacterised protein [Mycobacteroides abscessus subsp. abscessus]|nr:Uncharacterised protein [Mycobacteroides abscessus subsp. abscessus]
MQGVRRGKQNRREVVEFETARHAEFSDRVEQETEKIVDYGRHRAAVCYPGRPYVTLVEEVVSNDAVSATPYRQGNERTQSSMSGSTDPPTASEALPMVRPSCR